LLPIDKAHADPSLFDAQFGPQRRTNQHPLLCEIITRIENNKSRKKSFFGVIPNDKKLINQWQSMENLQTVFLEYFIQRNFN
jgi:hypothetical protein